jgi:hypothetical protein
VAAKNLCASMTTALETIVNCRQISSEALETAYFIKDVNDLFDSFNSTGMTLEMYLNFKFYALKLL